jgi:hypothetical protein
MSTFIGILLVVLIVLVAGLIAYVGDRVGHQVGRRRMTLFGLRPKYTSTIVAVATGMMIAFVATVVPLLTTPLARQAFFHLSEINAKVNDLEAQAEQLEKQTRESSIVISRGQPLYDKFLLITPQEAQPERRRALGAFFDAVVQSLNRTYVRQGLKAYVGKSSDPEIAAKLDKVLGDERVEGYLLSGPVIFVTVADYNLFVNDKIQFTFEPYLDQRIFAAGQSIASVEVDGGTQIVPNLAFSELSGAVSQTAIDYKMPYFFANALPSITQQDVDSMQRAIRAGKGRYYIIARAAGDVYVHSAGVPVRFELSRLAK